MKVNFTRNTKGTKVTILKSSITKQLEILLKEKLNFSHENKVYMTCYTELSIDEAEAIVKECKKNTYWGYGINDNRHK
jgi:hypothetical protein